MNSTPASTPEEEESSIPAELSPEILEPKSRWEFFRSEDWWAVWLGGLILLIAFGATWLSRPDDQMARVQRYEELTRQLDELDRAEPRDTEAIEALQKERTAAKAAIAVNPLSGWMSKVGSWDSNPLKALQQKDGSSRLPGLLGVFLFCLILFMIGTAGLGENVSRFPLAFLVVFLLAVFSYVLAGQSVIKGYNLEYALWGLLTGLIISNTVGTPQFLSSAVRTEFYIKTGLVLLGAEILFNRLLSLGLPGIFVSWVTTPVVLIATYIFGQKILKMQSRSLNMVISADMSVCGVSAAIATGAACRAKREELSLAIALSLGFTVGMMIVMPEVIKWMQLSDVLAGAWIGGTIDSTGAVAAAGGMMNSETVLTVAVTIKMIQNILIGVVAFGVSVYWVGWVERDPNSPRVSVWEIWRRFPKFMFGFLGASLVFSAISSMGTVEEETVNATIKGTTETIRGWLFCMAFVSIGLETNFKELLPYFKGGKPLVLYVVGQTLNLIMTFVMAWLMFEKVFPDVARTLSK